MSRKDEIIENQAARIRWLLGKADHRTYIEFTMNYVVEHPFPAEGTHTCECPSTLALIEEASNADDV